MRDRIPLVQLFERIADWPAERRRRRRKKRTHSHSWPLVYPVAPEPPAGQLGPASLAPKATRFRIVTLAALLVATILLAWAAIR